MPLNETHAKCMANKNNRNFLKYFFVARFLFVHFFVVGRSFSFFFVRYLMNVYAMHFAYQNVRAGNNDKISVELMKDESGRHSINAICNEEKNCALSI